MNRLRTASPAESIEIVRRMVDELGRRPTGKELWAKGVPVGGSNRFPTVPHLLEAAGLSTLTPENPLGLTPAEGELFDRLFRQKRSLTSIETKLGLPHGSGTKEAIRRGLMRSRSVDRSEAEHSITRRCLSPSCGQITRGLGPCIHCGAKGLSEAA